MKVSLIKQKTLRGTKAAKGFFGGIEFALTLLGVAVSIAVFWAPAFFDWGSAVQNIFQFASAGILGLVLLAAGLAAIMRRWVGNTPAVPLIADMDRGNIYQRIESDWYSIFTGEKPSRWEGVIRPVETETDLETFNRLNAEAFVATGSIWGYGYDLVSRRNTGLFRVEPRIFYLVCDQDGRAVGFSFVIPMGAAFRDLYIGGRISDAEISGEFLPASTQDVRSLVLFAVGKNYLRENLPGTARYEHNNFALLYMRALALHVKALVERYGTENLELIVQQEKRSIVRMLKRYGFERVGSESADGFPFYAVSLPKMLNRLRARIEGAPDAVRVAA